MELLFLIVMFGLLWALLIRPQQRRVRQHQELVSTLATGDEVITAGGIVGRVTAVDGDQLRLEVSPGVELRVVRGAVSRRVAPTADPGGHEPEDRP
jgi:preprotein translocase subunit YajC